MKDLQKIQNKALSIPEFERKSSNLRKLFNGPRIMKFKVKVTLSKCIFFKFNREKINEIWSFLGVRGLIVLDFDGIS